MSLKMQCTQSKQTRLRKQSDAIMFRKLADEFERHVRDTQIQTMLDRLPANASLELQRQVVREVCE